MAKSIGRAFKGLWLPAELWLNKELTITEKVVIAEIDSLNADGNGCHATNEYLGEFFGLKSSRTRELLRDLITREWLAVAMENGNERRLFAGPKAMAILGFHMPENRQGEGDGKASGGMTENRHPLYRENKVENKGGEKGSFFLDPESEETPKKKSKANETRIINEANAEIILMEYPKAVVDSRKDQAIRAIVRAFKTITFEKLREQVRAYKLATKDWDRKYIKQPWNWMDKQSYLDTWIDDGKQVPAVGKIEVAAKKLSAADRFAAYAKTN